MLLHTGLPVTIILTSRIFCIVFLLITSLIHCQAVASTLFSNNNDSKSILDVQSITSSTDRLVETTSKPASSALKPLMTYSATQIAKAIHDTEHVVSTPRSSKLRKRKKGRKIKNNSKKTSSPLKTSRPLKTSSPLKTSRPLKKTSGLLKTPSPLKTSRPLKKTSGLLKTSSPLKTTLSPLKISRSLKKTSSPLRTTPSPLKSLKPYSTEQTVRTTTNDGQQSYDVESWLPKKRKSVPGVQVNLTIFPVLALLSFLVALSLKCCAWFRESVREKESCSGFDETYFIIHHGDEEYMDVDFRSDTSTPYDTVSSYTSFLRSGSNYNTWNSVRSVQVVHPTNMQALHRAFLLHRKESQRNDSVNSYKAFMKKSAVLKDMEVQVELMTADEEKTKPNDKGLSTEGKHKKSVAKVTGARGTSSKATETENGFVSFQSNGIDLKNTQRVDPTVESQSVGVSNINSKKNIKDNENNCEEHTVNKSQKKPQRFNVSFVTDDCGNVVSSSQRNETMATPNIESPTHSPNSILSNSNVFPKTFEKYPNK